MAEFTKRRAPEYAAEESGEDHAVQRVPEEHPDLWGCAREVLVETPGYSKRFEFENVTT